MLVACWSPKGGSGTSVVAAGIALAGRPSLLVDLDGDQSALLGLTGSRPGVSEWLAALPDTPPDAIGRLEEQVAEDVALVAWGAGEPSTGDTVEAGLLLAGLLSGDPRLVVVDAGSARSPVAATVRSQADVSLCVLRPCYLAVRRAVARPTASVVILVDEPGRALGRSDVAAALDTEVVLTIPWDPAIARAVDAGVLADRQPRPLIRPIERWLQRVHG